MKKIETILVVSPNYPIQGDPGYAFVKNLVDEFARKGCVITILAPQSSLGILLHRKQRRPLVRYEDIGGSQVTIYQPYTFAPPSRFVRLFNYYMRKATMRFLKKNSIKADICYCHFYRSAYYILPYVKEHKTPLFVAAGEGALQNWKGLLSSPSYLEINKCLNGVISVSSNNKTISEDIGIIKGKDCLVAPNGVNGSLYHQKDRNELRKKYGFCQNDFIVAFVGLFTERKGSFRLSKAIEKVGNVKSFFIGYSVGDASFEPKCEGVLFKGKLPHDVIPDYLNMADVFVLPTLNEGCCNAIVEALACGLPVVSSDRPFNYDVLNETNSIMVDPTNVDAIADAINTLKNNAELRENLSLGALRMAEQLTIEHRANRILEFMENHS